MPRAPVPRTLPNPRVGCVLLRPDGTEIAVGVHRGAGTPHAEIEALAQAGDEAKGATAVVTLEPCTHTGRTGPCTQALIDAGVARVVHAQSDPDPVAAGGAGVLRDAGIDVESGVLADEAQALNIEWTFAVTHGRPFVTWKYAATMDGLSAAPDGSSKWITSAEARRDVQVFRAEADADHGRHRRGPGRRPAPHRARRRRPARCRTSSSRCVSSSARPRSRPTTGSSITSPRRCWCRTATRRPCSTTMAERGIRHVWLEGGPRLAGAFWNAGLRRPRHRLHRPGDARLGPGRAGG